MGDIQYIISEKSVVGFIDASFSGVEQGPGHSVPVGYLKGGTIAGQNLVFDVRNTPDTASEFIIYNTIESNYIVSLRYIYTLVDQWSLTRSCFIQFC